MTDEFPAHTTPADREQQRPGGKLLLPVGHDIGRQRIRRGIEFHDLGDAAYAVWRMAQGSPPAIENELVWGRRNVGELAAHSGVADADSALAGLLADGLLVEVAADSAEATEFARNHRVVTLLPGLGNTEEEPELFGIGMLGEPAVRVDFATYDIWSWSDLDDTLWGTCASAADVARQAGRTEMLYLEPDKLLAGFLTNLHALLLSGAAYVDVNFRLRQLPGEEAR